MKIEIENPEPIKNAPTSVFELVVTSMHGDGDLYTTESSFSDNEEELLPKLKVLEAFFNLSWNAGCDNNTVIAAIKAVDFPDGDALDFYSDIVGYEKLNDSGYFASPDSIELFWYNASGVKHICKMHNMKQRRG